MSQEPVPDGYAFLGYTLMIDLIYVNQLVLIHNIYGKAKLRRRVSNTKRRNAALWHTRVAVARRSTSRHGRWSY